MFSSLRLHHIAIAVKDIEKSRLIWELLLDTTFSPVKMCESQNVLVSFSNCNEFRLELVQAAGSQSPRYSLLPHPILSFIAKQGEGLHHIAFESQNLHYDVDRLKSLGFRMLSSEPEEGAEGPVIFLNPDDCGGTLIELCKVSDNDVI